MPHNGKWDTRKFAYFTGKLTGLSEDRREATLMLYERIAAYIEGGFPIKVYLPHRVSDPVAHKDWTPEQVDQLDRRAVTMSSFIIAMVNDDSVGAGIEIELAHHANKPVFLLVEKAKLDARLVSRLVRGNPAVVVVISYVDTEDMIEQLDDAITKTAHRYAHLPPALQLI